MLLGSAGFKTSVAVLSYCAGWFSVKKAADPVPTATSRTIIHQLFSNTFQYRVSSIVRILLLAQDLQSVCPSCDYAATGCYAWLSTRNSGTAGTSKAVLPDRTVEPVGCSSDFITLCAAS